MHYSRFHRLQEPRCMVMAQAQAQARAQRRSYTGTAGEPHTHHTHALVANASSGLRPASNQWTHSAPPSTMVYKTEDIPVGMKKKLSPSSTSASVSYFHIPY